LHPDKILADGKDENYAGIIQALYRKDDKLLSFTEKSVARIKGKY